MTAIGTRVDSTGTTYIVCYIVRTYYAAVAVLFLVNSIPKVNLLFVENLNNIHG